MVILHAWVTSIELYDNNDTLKLTYRLDSMSKSIDLTKSTELNDYYDLFMSGLQSIDKIHMSQALNLLYTKILNYGSPPKTRFGDLISSDFQ